MGESEPPGEAQPTHLAVGRIVRPHGIRGHVVLQPYSGLADRLAAGSSIFLGEAKRAHRVTSVRSSRGRVVLLIDGSRDREAAEQMRNQELFVLFDEVPPLSEGEYYHWQIVGLEVVTETNERLGEVEAILETGANDVYLVRTPDGHELLLPAIEQVILQVDLEHKQMMVRLLPGLR